MPNFTAGTSFTDGVTNDVTAAKLNALVADAVPTSSLALASTTGTISNFTASTANITLGTIPTLTAGTTTSTNEVVTNGTITNLSATTSTFLGTITGSTNVVNIGSGQIYKNASGNIGVGTTSPITKLDVSGGINSTGLNATGTGGFINGANKFGVDNNGGITRLYSSGTDSSTRGAFDFRGTDSVGALDISRMLIDSSGNVGVGTTSLSSYSGYTSLTIGNTSNGGLVSFRSTSAISGNLYGNNSQVSLESLIGGNPIIIATTPSGGSLTERLRITSGGEVYIAGTTDQGAYNLQVNGTGVWGAGAYVNGSDSRIKEDIQPLASGLDVVEKLNPVTYKYKETWSSDQSIQSGFIAQELLTALDGQIYVDGVVQQGGAEGYYSVAYQNLIPVLAKAIQELKSENDSLKSRIEALESA